MQITFESPSTSLASAGSYESVSVCLVKMTRTWANVLSCKLAYLRRGLKKHSRTNSKKAGPPGP